MRRSSRKQPKKLMQAGIDQHDSPTIQNLIEQLARDLKETQRDQGAVEHKLSAYTFNS